MYMHSLFHRIQIKILKIKNLNSQYNPASKISAFKHPKSQPDLAVALRDRTTTLRICVS